VPENFVGASAYAHPTATSAGDQTQPMRRASLEIVKAFQHKERTILGTTTDARPDLREWAKEEWPELMDSSPMPRHDYET
jgi:hypothetical protein